MQNNINKENSLNHLIKNQNLLLTTIYRKEMTCGDYLYSLGFTKQQVDIIIDNFLYSLLDLIWETVNQFFLDSPADIRYWTILSQRYDPYIKKRKTLQELGLEFSICRERVRQLEGQAFRKLRVRCRRYYIEEKVVSQVFAWIHSYQQNTDQDLDFNSCEGQIIKFTEIKKNREHSPKRANEYWTGDEQNTLISLYQQNVSIEQISLQLQRSERAIQMRLNKLGFELQADISPIVLNIFKSL